MSDKGNGVEPPDLPEFLLPGEETEAERLQRLRSFVVPLDEAIYDNKPVDWLVDGLIPRGSVILLAGEPKLARKSVLSMYFALCVATGQPFLGKATRKGEVLFANYEDGYTRTIRRYFHFGVRPGLSSGPLYIMKGLMDLDQLEEYIRAFRPAIAFVDPAVELELLSGVENENDAREIAKMFKRIRELAQDTSTVIFIVHHYNKSGDVRGSTAFKGSTDGWFEIIYRRNKPRLLRWTLRDAPEGEVELNIEYEDDVARVEVVGEFRNHHTSGGGSRATAEPESKDGAWSARRAEVGEKIRRLLSHSDESYSINQISKKVGSNKQTVKAILEQFEEDLVVARQGDRWIYNPGDGECL